MRTIDDRTAEANAGLPSAAALAVERAALPDPNRAFVVGFGDGQVSVGVEATGSVPGARESGNAAGGSGLAEAWAGRRHLILRCGPGLSPEDAVEGLVASGVPAEAPALLALELGTGRERLLYGSVEDVASARLGEEAVLVVPHPAALPLDFAWPPTAAPPGD